jgi:Rrf2 family cysteine metabolism transcriptional repressor
MVFSARTEYGLVALLDLAAAHASGDRVQTGEICRRHGMPERYLEQMLTALRKGGYLVSVRGPRGGYQLTRAPELITVAEVEKCLDGESRVERQGARDSAEFQVLEELQQRAARARAAVLESTTLAHLLEACDHVRPPGEMFYI